MSRNLMAPACAAALALLVSCGAFTGGSGDLGGKVDTLQQEVAGLTQQQRQLTEQVAALRKELAGRRAMAAGSTAAEKPQTAEIKDLSVGSGALYKEAFGLMEAGKFQDAEGRFAEFVSKYPQSDLADNAQYWIGECLYSERKYQDAQAAFDAVSVHFPFGNKVPDALYKEALCQKLLGREGEADATLKKLMEDFPDSEAAAKAKALQP